MALVERAKAEFFQDGDTEAIALFDSYCIQYVMARGAWPTWEQFKHMALKVHVTLSDPTGLNPEP